MKNVNKTSNDQVSQRTEILINTDLFTSSNVIALAAEDSDIHFRAALSQKATLLIVYKSGTSLVSETCKALSNPSYLFTRSSAASPPFAALAESGSLTPQQNLVVNLRIFALAFWIVILLLPKLF